MMAMSIWRLVAREIGHRFTGFALSCAAVAAAVACVVGARALLIAHDIGTERLLEGKEAATRAEMSRMEDDYRKIMRRMGYNVLVLPGGQDMSELHALGHATATMPEADAERLAAAGIETLSHLLPVLQGRMRWPETGREILLTGIRGQLAVAGDPRRRPPIMEPVARGALVLGHIIAKSAGLEAGDATVLNGEPFTVQRVHPARGTMDDITVWVQLDIAQNWLGQSERINGILALECICEPDSLGRIEAEVNAVLPDAQVFEFSSKVRGRAEARARAAEAHRTAIEAERMHRVSLREERERLARAAVPGAVAVAAGLVMFLAFTNARERRGEIGILRAVGFSRLLILRTFLIKAVITGFAGGAAGLAVGIAAGLAWVGPEVAAGAGYFASPAVVLLALLGAPALACVSTLPPALGAARQEPAVVLREE